MRLFEPLLAAMVTVAPQTGEEINAKKLRRIGVTSKGSRNELR
jgi:hypothetical protein